jgi:antitoxin ParD1/3/4
MSIGSLPPDLEQFVQDQLAQGKYQSESEVLCDAVRLMKQRELRLESLRMEIDRGLEQLDHGDYIELEGEADLRAFFEDIKARGRKRLDNRRASQ